MKNILRAAFIAWVILWAIFIARELFVKTNLKDYRELISRTAEGKRSYLMGDDLYGFIEFCKKNTPDSATYNIAGIEEGAIEKRRAAYYLYPRREAPDGDFIFVYRSPAAGRDGYAVFMKLDDSRYILKRRTGK